MNPELFEQFLRDSRNKLEETEAQDQKVRTYIVWCTRNGHEETILRLSSEEKGGWSDNYSLTFTTSRIIVNKKKFSTKFIDLGYAAGLAPYPYLILLKKRDYSKIREDATISPDVLSQEPNSYHIWYSEIEEFVLRPGMRMLGKNITSNFLTIVTSAPVSKRYDYTLPISKNGDYGKMHYWLKVALPQNCPIKS